MNNAKQHLDSLSEIKNLMERSTKFMSLSGLSGVIAGILALAGAVLAYMRITYYAVPENINRFSYSEISINTRLTQELFLIAAMILILSVSFAILLTVRESKKNGQSIWDKTSKLLFTNLMIPLATGGLFCLILLYHNAYIFVAPATLIFYGLALVNCSKYTVTEIRYLGLLEIALGLLSAIYVGRGLIFWAIGFGILHIVYGTMMHFKYNRTAVNS